MKTSTKGKRIVKSYAYTAQHLRRYYPEAFERAHTEYRHHLDLSHVQDEMMDSLKGLFEAAGVTLADWRLGAYSQGCYIKARFSNNDDIDGVKNLKGARAMAWLENNLYGPLRRPWGLRPVSADNKHYAYGTHNSVYNTDSTTGKPVRRWYAPGSVPDCPFTGCSYDMDFLDALNKSIRDGDTLKEAFEGLEHTFTTQLESEYEYQGEAAQFLEAAMMNEWEFTKEGKQI